MPCVLSATRLPFAAVASLLLLACCARGVHGAPVGPAPPAPGGANNPPPAAVCSGPEPAWLTSSWWPVGALFRCGCGLTSYGSAYAWNDVAICAALGDLLFATAGPQPLHAAVQTTVQPFTFYWSNWLFSQPRGWGNAVANISADYCDFDKIICGISATNVTSAKGYGLFLSTINLTGTLPASFSALAALPDINILDMGQLPNLTVDPDVLVPFAPSLTYLGLSYTSLAGGTLPPSLGSLTQLRVLQAGNNALSGTLPPELGRLTRLTDLQLGGNALTGGIPDTWSNMTALTTLFLNRNLLSGSLHGATCVPSLRMLPACAYARATTLHAGCAP